MASRPVHFEIHATDPEAIGAFYTSIFGWRVERWGEVPYWIVVTGEEGEGAGINGGIAPRETRPPAGDDPVSGWILTVEVPDCDGYVAKVVQAGGSVSMEPQDMPGVGRVSYVRDPDGNVFGMLQPEGSSA